MADQRGNRQSIVAQGVAAAFRFPFGVVSKLGQGFGLIEGAGRKFFTGYGTNPHKVKELAEEMYNLFVEGDHKLVSDILDNTMTRGFENMEEGVDQFFNIHKDRSYREGN